MPAARYSLIGLLLLISAAPLAAQERFCPRAERASALEAFLPTDDLTLDAVAREALARLARVTRTFPELHYVNHRPGRVAEVWVPVEGAGQSRSTILLDPAEARALVAEGGGDPVLLAAVLAHEFGHVVQAEMEPKRWGSTREWCELHANLLGGYLLRSHPEYRSWGVIRQPMQSAFFRSAKEFGAEPLPQRVAFQLGFEGRFDDVWSAALAGAAFVDELVTRAGDLKTIASVRRSPPPVSDSVTCSDKRRRGGEAGLPFIEIEGSCRNESTERFRVYAISETSLEIQDEGSRPHTTRLAEFVLEPGQVCRYRMRHRVSRSDPHEKWGVARQEIARRERADGSPYRSAGVECASFDPSNGAET